MRNYPKHINNREDLNYLMTEYPVGTREFLQGVLDNRKIWAASGELATVGDGVTDATHKVVAEEDKAQETNTIYQMELMDNLGVIVKYGFTSFEEVEAYLGKELASRV